MKNSLLFISLFVLSAIYSKSLSAQDCDFYFPTEKGTIVETTYYDKKNKETSKLYQEVLEYTKSNGVTQVKIKNQIKTQESDSTLTQEYSVRCENGEFYINMDSYLSQEALSPYQNMEIEVDTENMTIPSTLSKGQVLKGGNVSAKISNSGVKILTMSVNVLNRKVEDFEKITTPAGTFDCVKISYDMEMKMIFKVKASGIQWFAKDVGVVKSETYDKKGKLESTQLITKISK